VRRTNRESSEDFGERAHDISRLLGAEKSQEYNSPFKGVTPLIGGIPLSVAARKCLAHLPNLLLEPSTQIEKQFCQAKILILLVLQEVVESARINGW